MPLQLSAREDTNRRVLRARDEMDRRYAEPLDVPTLAAIAHLSASQFGRVFKEVYGETPHRYLQRRRVERAMNLLRSTDLDVTQVCLAVGFTSLGTFSRLFSAVVGESPTAYAARGPLPPAPGCFTMAWTRPSTFVPPPARALPARPPDPSISEKPDPVRPG